MLFLCTADLPAQESAQLSARPNWVCSGDEYEIVWNGGARHQLMRDGLRGELRPGLRFTARTETVLRALDPRGDVVSTDTVSVHPQQMEHNLIRKVATCAGRLSLTSMAIPPAVASDRIKPRRVVNLGTTAVYVMHRGIVVKIEPGATTDGFNDVPFSGDWGVVVDTGAYNAACPVGDSAGPAIVVRIVTMC